MKTQQLEGLHVKKRVKVHKKVNIHMNNVKECKVVYKKVSKENLITAFLFYVLVFVLIGR